MNKNRFIIYFVFLITVLFIFVPKIDAEKYNTCVYRHPNYEDCRLALWKEKGTNDWTFLNTQSLNSSPSFIQKIFDSDAIDMSKCATVNGKDIRTIVPNVKHNEKFYTQFNKAYKNNNNKCPDLYIGKNIYSCGKADSLNMAGTGDCFMAYLNREGFSSRIKVSASVDDELNENEYSDFVKDDIEYSGKTSTKAKIDVLTGLGIKEGDYTCEQLLGDDVVKLLEKIFVIIRILTPILLIVFTMIDYTKAIAAGEDEIKNATTKFIKRSIAAILIFLAPTLIEFIMDVTGISDGTCGLDL